MNAIYNFTIGFDVSKKKLDTGICHSNRIVSQDVIPNDREAIKEWLLGLNLDFSGILLCMEHTGVYSRPLLAAATELGVAIWQVDPTQLNMSTGVRRGKNDKDDAARIARFAWRFQDEARPYKCPSSLANKIKPLMAQRSRIVKSIHRFKLPVKELADMGQEIDILNSSTKAILEALELQLDEIETRVGLLISSCETCSRIFEILVSIPGIGPVVATGFILNTGMFEKITDARSFASYSGVAPFQKQSGSSIRGKNKVSHRANKKMKTLLQLAAMAAVSGNNRFSDYYYRKVGRDKNNPKKNPMSVMNAVRNKIIHVAFACIKNGTKYQKEFRHSLAKA